MSTTADFIHSLGSLFDLSEQKTRLKSRRLDVNLEYDFNSDDVSSAWSDVTVLVSDSFAQLTEDKDLLRKVELYKHNVEDYRKSLRVDDLVRLSVDDIATKIENISAISRPFDGSKLKAKFDSRRCNNDAR